MSRVLESHSRGVDRQSAWDYFLDVVPKELPTMTKSQSQGWFCIFCECRGLTSPCSYKSGYIYMCCFVHLLSCTVTRPFSTEEIVQIALLVIVTTLLVALLLTLAVCYLRYGQGQFCRFSANRDNKQHIYRLCFASVCDIGVLWLNTWMDQIQTLPMHHAGFLKGRIFNCR